MRDTNAAENASPGNTAPSSSHMLNDPRVSYDKVAGKWIFEGDDGTEWVYEAERDTWVQEVGDDLLSQQQSVYVKEETHGTKRDAEKNEKNGPVRRNTAIYVTNLPLDVTAEEMSSVFSKCGLIAEDAETGKPRIKLYTDATGNLKGDGLVVYHRPESIELAIQLLDDTDLRLGAPVANGKMRVHKADFESKEKKTDDEQRNPEHRRKVIKKKQKLNSKLADWSDDDLPDRPVRKTAKMVILKHMFDPNELEEDPSVMLDLKEDVREECEKLGQVTNVVLYDKEEEGVISIKFQDEDAAALCVQRMHGRKFDGRTVDASIHDGQKRYRKSGKATDGDDQSRLEKFAAWLEQEEQEQEQDKE